MLRIELWFALQLTDSTGDGRMLSSHTLYYLYNPIGFTKLFQIPIPLRGHITQTLYCTMVEADLSLKLVSPRTAWVLGFHWCRILQNNIYTLMQMILSSFDANLSRENLLPYASCEPSQATDFPVCFFLGSMPSLAGLLSSDLNLDTWTY